MDVEPELEDEPERRTVELLLLELPPDEFELRLLELFDELLTDELRVAELPDELSTDELRLFELLDEPADEALPDELRELELLEELFTEEPLFDELRVSERTDELPEDVLFREGETAVPLVADEDDVAFPELRVADSLPEERCDCAEAGSCRRLPNDDVPVLFKEVPRR